MEIFLCLMMIFFSVLALAGIHWAIVTLAILTIIGNALNILL